MSVLVETEPSVVEVAIRVPSDQYTTDNQELLLPISSGDLALELRNHRDKFHGAACHKINRTDSTKADYIEFDPGQGESTNPAKLVCNQCCRQDKCLTYALDNNIDFMIWGGTSGRERREIKKAYATGVASGNIDPIRTSIGQFASENRQKLIIPGNSNKKTTSYRARELDVSKANCLTKHSRLFEDLDSKKPGNASITERLALAIIACRTCVLYKYCREDPFEPTTQSLPTVVGGEIEGYVPRRKRPTEKFIASLIPEVHQAEWLALNESLRKSA